MIRYHSRLIWLRGVLLVVLALGPVLAGAIGVEDFQARTYQDAKGKTLGYRLFVPRHYDKSQKYPLILFLHGSGERGSDNLKQVGYFAKSVFADDLNQAANPCFLLAPQCPDGEKWSELIWNDRAAEQPTPLEEPMRLTLELLTALQQEFSIDSQRLYITGLSLGGFGTWDAIARKPGMFAAAIPICGGGDVMTAPRMLHTPIWAFHGGADPTVPTARTRHLIIALTSLGGTPKYTEYPGVGHDSWTKAYREPELAAWTFAQRLDRPANSPPTVPMLKLKLAGKKAFGDPALIVAWQASEKNAGAVKDFSAHGNDLVPALGQGGIQENNVLNFSDAQPVVEFMPKDETGLQQAMTIMAWVWKAPGQFEPEILFAKEIPGENKTAFRLELDNLHQIKVTLSTVNKPDVTVTGKTIDALGWHHVAMTYASNTLELFLDGVSQGKAAGDGEIIPLSRPILIGGREKGYNLFIGTMNDVRIYKRALAAAEVAALAGAKTGAPPRR